MAFKGITAFVLGNNGEGGGGGGGTSNYNDLTNHPQINGNELIGNKTAAQLGLLPSDTDIPTKLSDLDADETHRTVTDSEKQSWNSKVDSVAGKGLSTNDYTNEDKTALANKVDKVTGKGLSTNDYSNEDKAALANKVDKVTGKGLSTNDYTDGDKEDVAQIDGLVGSVGSLTSRVGIAEGKVRTLEGEMLSVQDSLDTKVDKETGKGLSTNDYTNADKAIVDGVTTALAGKVDTSSVGTANGVAGLDNTGRVPSSQLPSYVDDVIEYASLSVFPATGEGSKIYVAQDTNKTYRWSGSEYVEISESLALGETQGTAYEGNKGKANADAIDVLETTVGAIPGQIETVVKDTVGWVGKNYNKGDANHVFVKGTARTFWFPFSIPIANGHKYKFVADVSSISGYTGTVALSFRITSTSGDISNTSNIQVTAQGQQVIEMTATGSADSRASVYCFIPNAEGDNATITLSNVMILEESVTDYSYEPYHETVQEMFDSLGTASSKNSTSVVTDSSDLVESGAVKDIIGWGNDIVDIPTPFVNGVLSWDDSADTIGTNSMYITSPYIPIREDVITISATKGDIVRIYYTDENHNKIYFVGNIPVNGDTLTIPKKDGAKYIRFSIGGLGTVTYTDYGTKLKANIVYGSEPYHASVEESKCDNSVIGPAENGSTASQAYAVGDYFIKDAILGKTKAAIASGGTFTKDTNYEETNVAKEMTELYKYIGILTTPVEAFTANSLPILKRNITNAFYNGSLRAEIAAGNFKNVRPGDYIIGQATGSTYYVAECDYWLGNGDSTNGTTYPAYNTHHLGLMLFKPVGTTALWRGYGYSDKSWRVSAADLGRCPWNAEADVDPTDTEAMGSNSTNITRSYNGTNMSAYMGSFIRERIDAILLPQCFQADFGSENVLKRRNWLSNAINTSAISGARGDWTGIASSSVWIDRFIDLASEVELYGSRINSSSRDDIGVQNKQLAIYRNGRIHDFYSRMDLWTKGVASATGAAFRGYNGIASAHGASLALWACPLGCVK